VSRGVSAGAGAAADGADAGVEPGCAVELAPCGPEHVAVIDAAAIASSIERHGRPRLNPVLHTTVLFAMRESLSQGPWPVVVPAH
jgi:hypothetical protein